MDTRSAIIIVIWQATFIVDVDCRYNSSSGNKDGITGGTCYYDTDCENSVVCDLTNNLCKIDIYGNCDSTQDCVTGMRCYPVSFCKITHGRMCHTSKDCPVGVPCETRTMCVPQEESLRLIDGHRHSIGRVEVFHEYTWGSICDHYFGKKEASVICRQLGFRSFFVKYFRKEIGISNGPIWLDDVQCIGDENSLSECKHKEYGDTNCDHYEDIAVDCNPQPVNGTVRLVGGANMMSGRLEIFYIDQWGTVCQDNFGANEASVVCNELGFHSTTSQVISPDVYGSGSGTILLDNVQCSDLSVELADCDHQPWGDHDCDHRDDVGVDCNPEISEGSVRLVGGRNNYEGILSIYHDGKWGTVCDGGFGLRDANVVCSQLGLIESNINFQSGYRYQFIDGPVWLQFVDCCGSETELSQCDHQEWGVSNCSHVNDIYLHCHRNNRYNAIRLVGGDYPYEGRVEIYHSSEWGTVCHDMFGIAEAQVVCRQLGFPGVGAISSYGSGSGAIWLDDVDCVGSESQLARCTLQPWGETNCTHDEDVGVDCTPICS